MSGRIVGPGAAGVGQARQECQVMAPELPAERPHAPTPAGLLDEALCHQAPGLVTRIAGLLEPADTVALVHAIERAERVRLNRATGVDIDKMLTDAQERLRRARHVERFPDAAAERFGVPSRLD